MRPDCPAPLNGEPSIARFDSAYTPAYVPTVDLHGDGVRRIYPGAIDEVDDEQRSSEKFFQDIQDEAVRQITGAGLVVQREIRPGHAAQALPHYAMEVGADLLVIGHSGHSAIWGRLLGTTADKVVDHAPCSVLVVR